MDKERIKNSIRFIELFAGIGGFRYGLEGIDREKDRGSQEDKKGNEREGLESQKRKETSTKTRQLDERSNSNPNSRTFNCVWANDNDKYACQIYRKNFSEGLCTENEEEKVPRIRDTEGQGSEQPDLGSKGFNGNYDERSRLYEGDITEVDTKDIPDHDMLVGGFPCQAFSIAGKRGGFDDTRGTLFFEVARILRDKRPGCVILENVKGLLSHDGGKTFQTILKVLSDIGYRVEWQILNSKNFGVPQNRERVFIVGYLRGTGRGQVFPIGGCNKELDEKDAQRNDIAHTITNTDKHRGSYVWTDEQDTQEEWDKPNDSNVIRRTPYTDDMRIRRLTPIECERLQGFPDNWTEEGLKDRDTFVNISDTQRYKCLGNAVTTNVVRAVREMLTR